ncbi:MAG: WD40 repeat domain-containing protein [Planctomycetes bacterium]|nr:WD40 repeat domain-containing protein [Planctomycetota bacterium]
MHTNIGTRAALLLLLISGFSLLACMPRGGPAGRGLENVQAKQEEPIGKPGKRATDSFGDPLPPGAAARLGTVRFRHGNGVSLIAFSADGKKIAIGGGDAVDNAIRMIETSTGKEIRTFELRPEERLWNIALSPDGNTLVIGAFSSSKPEGGFVVWDTTTSKKLARIEKGKQPSDVVVFSPNGKVFVTQDYLRIGNTNNFDTRMHVWDASTGKLLHEFKDLEGKVSRPVFSPDGKRLAISISTHDKPGEPTTGFFYDTATWRLVQPMAARPLLKEWHACRRYDREFLAYSPDGKLLVGGDWFNHVDFMNAQTGELIERQRLFGGWDAVPVRSLSFSHDGKMLAVVTENGIVKIWENNAKGKVLYNLDGSHYAAVFAPAEPLLATGGGWSERFGSIPGRNYPTLRFWNPSTGKEIFKGDSPAATVQLTHWLDGGKLLAVSPLENCYRLWDCSKSKELAKMPLGEKEKWVAWSSVSANGKLLAVSQYSGQGNDETIYLFDLAAGKVIHRLESKMVRLPVGFTADGRFLLAGVDSNLVTIWDTADGKIARRLDLDKELGGGPDLQRLKGRGYARLAAISGDGKKLALEASELLVEPSGEDPGGVLWPTGYYRCVIDMTTGKKLWATIRDDSRQPSIVSAFRFSPDGKILAERVGQTISLRNSANGDLLRTLKCEKEWWEWTKQADALAFTPDSKKLIAADLHNNIYVWDIATGKELQKLTGHRGRIFSVSVSSDARMFATSSEDSTVLIWQLDGG